MPIGVPLVRFLGQLVGVGEEAGRLAAFLTKAADTLGEQTERALRGAKTWLRR